MKVRAVRTRSVTRGVSAATDAMRSRLVLTASWQRQEPSNMVFGWRPNEEEPAANGANRRTVPGRMMVDVFMPPLNGNRRGGVQPERGLWSEPTLSTVC